MKLSALASNKPPSSYDQTSDDIIQLPLLKSPEKYPHASQFTKHISSITLEVETIIHIQKLWDSILSEFFQSLLTKKIYLA